ncbi:MAG: hypothetical protein ACD_70C00023G0002 [uncultured bacterium]|nr:MAG: hypothetical protein ACD_70C00023G0002 [uncultured bacterium]OGT25408.1 MAG: hypothetical protein A3B71_04990 [Gammaproteobacteria bacterium RIFCSPHIGHO2_02_FULL_42_43]OGT28911.1 MAG: hypothetical protein A2624_02315 [Gammaproteobacteria bacterium RIFCSPHIGHO2_01_FULL_42_8]OGT51360.1 MAG: hypothetical protein A3E54_04755 [Gammaproteobacteria bacterium RIFCSPHIGHO2_12_FULL_41_25]OGT62062.1 MAG: hypothetical protein A3I77_03685 [Gammaproteobacteria bacterium RIFCSPLOWO2_02_FULL_42_14]OGT
MSTPHYDSRINSLFQTIGKALAQCPTVEAQQAFLQNLKLAITESPKEYTLPSKEIIDRQLEREYASQFLQWASACHTLINRKTASQSELPVQLLFSLFSGFEKVKQPSDLFRQPTGSTKITSAEIPRKK